jgi:hypothetical protein
MTTKTTVKASVTKHTAKTKEERGDAAKNAKDKEVNAKTKKVNTKDKKDEKRAKTGYNVFTAEMMKQLKEEAKIEGKERLKEVGRLWKLLSDDEKVNYDILANEMNEKEGRPFTKPKENKPKSGSTVDTKKSKTITKDEKKKVESTEDLESEASDVDE